MSGKKGKKTKGKTIPLQAFLGDTPGGTMPTMPKIKSWADEQDDDDYGYSSRPKEPVVLPTAPRAARDQSMIEEQVPKEPPYVAYISNLPYDIDENDIAEFFQDMNVENIRLPKEQTKFKGYGYVIFEDRQSLIDAITMPETTLKTRRVRIEVSTNSNDDRRGGGGRMGRMGDQRRDYNDDPERTTGDWRTRGSNDGPSSMEDEPRREDRYRSRGGGFGGDRREDRDNGFEDKPGNWRDGPREMANSDRPRRDDRGGAGSGGGERDWNRFADRGRGGGARDGSSERNGTDRGQNSGGGGFGPRRHYNDDAEKDRERWSSIRSQPRENIEGTPAEPPKTRPTLNLQPRTKPIEPIVVAKSDEEKETTKPSDDSKDATSEESKSEGPVEPPKPAANIFGAAKPVDTAAREREIEERLAKSATIEATRKDEEKKSDERTAAPKEGAWGRRNGEGGGNSRFDTEKNSRPAWRSRTNDQKDQQSQRDGDRRDFRDSREPREHREGVRNIETKNSLTNRNATGGPPARGPPKQIDSKQDGVEKDHKKDKEEKEIDISKMPKAKEDTAPNFVASNKYSMLPDDVDPDNIED